MTDMIEVGPKFSVALPVESYAIVIEDMETFLTMVCSVWNGGGDLIMEGFPVTFKRPKDWKNIPSGTRIVMVVKPEVKGD